MSMQVEQPIELSRFDQKSGLIQEEEIPKQI